MCMLYNATFTGFGDRLGWGINLLHVICITITPSLSIITTMLSALTKKVKKETNCWPVLGKIKC